MTPIIETMRSLLTAGTPGPDIWLALTWAAGILVVSYTLAVGMYRCSACPGSPVSPDSGPGGAGNRLPARLRLLGVRPD